MYNQYTIFRREGQTNLCNYFGKESWFPVRVLCPQCMQKFPIDYPETKSDALFFWLRVNFLSISDPDISFLKMIIKVLSILGLE